MTTSIPLPVCIRAPRRSEWDYYATSRAKLQHPNLALSTARGPEQKNLFTRAFVCYTGGEPLSRLPDSTEIGAMHHEQSELEH